MSLILTFLLHTRRDECQRTFSHRLLRHTVNPPTRALPGPQVTPLELALRTQLHRRISAYPAILKGIQRRIIVFQESGRRLRYEVVPSRRQIYQPMKLMGITIIYQLYEKCSQRLVQAPKVQSHLAIFQPIIAHLLHQTYRLHPRPALAI